MKFHEWPRIPSKEPRVTAENHQSTIQTKQATATKSEISCLEKEADLLKSQVKQSQACTTVHTCSSNPLEAEAGELQLWSQFGLYSKTLY